MHVMNQPHAIVAVQGFPRLLIGQMHRRQCVDDWKIGREEVRDDDPTIAAIPAFGLGCHRLQQLAMHVQREHGSGLVDPPPAQYLFQRKIGLSTKARPQIGRFGLELIPSPAARQIGTGRRCDPIFTANPAAPAQPSFPRCPSDFLLRRQGMNHHFPVLINANRPAISAIRMIDALRHWKQYLFARHAHRLSCVENARRAESRQEMPVNRIATH